MINYECKIQFEIDGNTINANGYLNSVECHVDYIDITEVGDIFKRMLVRRNYTAGMTFTMDETTTEDRDGNRKSQEECERLFRKLNIKE